MSTTAMEIGYKLETGIITELAKRTYFANGGTGAGTSMLHFMDNSSTERPVEYLVVHAHPAERLQPNSNFYKVPVSIACLSHIPNDKARTTCKALYQECLDFIQKFDKSAVGTSASLTIDGIVPTVGDESINPVENYQMMMVNADVYITKT